MNFRKFSATILVLLLMTSTILGGCSGSKPAEAPAATEAAPAASTAETAPAAPAAAPESTPAPPAENKPAEGAAPQVPAADTASQPAAQPVIQPAAEAAQAQPAQTSETKTAAPAAAVQPAAETSTAPASSYKGVLEAPIAEQPVFLTSSGQSADVQMVKVLLDRAKIKYVISTIAKPEELKDVKTLILAVGGSSKGLGAAGIDAEDELERTKAIISKAKELKLKIITLHVGGEARRGELSDKFINACVPSSDYVVVVEEGNKDSLFTKLTDANSIPMDVVKKITEVVEPLKSALK